MRRSVAALGAAQGDAAHQRPGDRGRREPLPDPAQGGRRAGRLRVVPVERPGERDLKPSYLN